MLWPAVVSTTRVISVGLCEASNDPLGNRCGHLNPLQYLRIQAPGVLKGLCFRPQDGYVTEGGTFKICVLYDS